MVSIDILVKENDNGGHKIWAKLKGSGRVCHGTAVGSVTGLSIKDSSVTTESKLKSGYKRLIEVRDGSMAALDDDTFKGVIGGVSRAISTTHRPAPGMSSVEMLTADDMLESGVTPDFLRDIIAGRANSRGISNMLFLVGGEQNAPVSPAFVPGIMSAVTQPDSVWNF